MSFADDQLPDRYERRANELEVAQIKRWEDSGHGLEWWHEEPEKELQIIISHLRRASKTYRPRKDAE